jgi:hypothetical protein
MGPRRRVAATARTADNHLKARAGSHPGADPRPTPIRKMTSSRLIRNIPLDGADGANTRSVFCSDGCTVAAVSAPVRDAYWYASQLINVGWLIRHIGTAEDRGFFVAETPRRRVVSVDERARPHTDPAAQFAKSITILTAAGAADGRDYLRDLVRLLREHAPLRRPATLT